MHVVRKAGPVAAILVIALLSAHAVTAQSKATLTLTVPPGPTTIPQGGNASLALKVHLAIDGMVCPSAGTATVTLAAPDPNPVQGIAFALSSSSVVFDITGPQAYSANGPYNADGSQDKTVYLNATVAKGTLANHEHPVNVTATFAGSGSGLAGGCNVTPSNVPGTAMDVSDAKGTKLLTGPAIGGTVGGNSTSGTTPKGSTSKASFSLPIAIEVVALLGLGLVASRRKAE